MMGKGAFGTVLAMVLGLGGAALAQDEDPEEGLQILGSNDRIASNHLCYFDGKAFSVGAHKTMASTLFRCSRSALFGVSWSAFPPEGYCKEGEHDYPSGAMIRRGEGDEAVLVTCENGDWIEG